MVAEGRTMTSDWRYCRPRRKRKPRQEELDAVRAMLERTGIQVVSDAEAEECDAVICNTAEMWSPFRDNTYAACATCDTAIYHRPHVPKKPRKICINCAVAEQPSEP